jgi:LPPG:FO 2-phospho-L-lactate transferase
VTVVVLAGGTGGAKLARGMLDVVGDELVVVANTADDVEIYRAHVSPDPDLVTFWLADAIDERGWGLADDTFAVMDGLRAIGEDVWFNLGDRDLAICLRRAERLAAGRRLTEAQAEIVESFGVRARVLPMSDVAFRTIVTAAGRVWPFQEFMIRHGAQGPIEDVAFESDEVLGEGAAGATPEVLEAIATARAIVIGPSNPVISIGPILAVPGVAEALREASAPVVAVSPIVDGQVLKGPTADFLAWAGQTMDAPGIAATYAGVIDGIVTDERADLDVPSLVTSTLMSDAESRARVARETLDFALALASST